MIAGDGMLGFDCLGIPLFRPVWVWTLAGGVKSGGGGRAER